MSTIEFLTSLSLLVVALTEYIIYHATFVVCSYRFRLLIKASGAGDYWGDYRDVKCKVYFKAEPYQKEDDDRTYLNVETVKMDFSVKDIEMGVENDNNNRVIRKHENVIYEMMNIYIKLIEIHFRFFCVM